MTKGSKILLIILSLYLAPYDIISVISYKNYENFIELESTVLFLKLCSFDISLRLLFIVTSYEDI